MWNAVHALSWHAHVHSCSFLQGLYYAAGSRHTCCAFVNFQMHFLSTTMRPWFTVATSPHLGWLECGGEKKMGNQARKQLVSGQCTQLRKRHPKPSVGPATEKRLAKVDSSLAGTCMSCKPWVLMVDAVFMFVYYYTIVPNPMLDFHEHIFAA